MIRLLCILLDAVFKYKHNPFHETIVDKRVSQQFLKSGYSRIAAILKNNSLYYNYSFYQIFSANSFLSHFSFIMLLYKHMPNTYLSSNKLENLEDKDVNQNVCHLNLLMKCKFITPINREVVDRVYLWRWYYAIIWFLQIYILKTILKQPYVIILYLLREIWLK